HSLILSCHQHGIHSLLVSFAYRYYVLVRDPPRVYKVAATVILVYLPTFFVFIAFASSDEDQAIVKADIEKNLGHDMSSECFSSEKEWGLNLSSYYLMLPPLPIYITILILRRLIISKITLQTTMSERTRQLHKQLLRKMTWVWWTSNSVNVIANAIGIVANSILIYMVLRRTPRHLISYSVLIFNISLCDLLACIGAIFMLLRAVAYGSSSYSFYYGPCRLFGSEICLIAQGFTITCHYHGIHSLLVSVAYRYYVLGRIPPRIYKVAATIILVYLPSFFVFIIYASSGDEEEQVKADIVKNLGYDKADNVEN
ncbi:hypothetical protein V3C99_002671, partial [Haemonchus contortus]